MSRGYSQYAASLAQDESENDSDADMEYQPASGGETTGTDGDEDVEILEGITEEDEDYEDEDDDEDFEDAAEQVMEQLIEDGRAVVGEDGTITVDMAGFDDGEEDDEEDDDDAEPSADTPAGFAPVTETSVPGTTTAAPPAPPQRTTQASMLSCTFVLRLLISSLSDRNAIPPSTAKIRPTSRFGRLRSTLCWCRR